MDDVSLRQLNRWTLDRQHLIERAPIDPVTAVEGLAGMQAQYPPSPYIGLWSRVEAFQRNDLERAIATDQVVKATLMRGTLHLLATPRLPHYRIAVGSAVYDDIRRRLLALGADLDAIRAHVVAEVSLRARSRAEVSGLVADCLTGEVPAWVRERVAGVAGVAVTTDLVNLAEDAAYGYFGGARYRVAPTTATVEPDEAVRQVVIDYLKAFGPASRADLAQWSGRPVRSFATALAELDLVSFRTEDGRSVLDLAAARRPSSVGAVPVRFLPKWDSLLLAHAKRERVLPEHHRRTVIAKNGDVSPTFLLDGTVAGTWAAPMRGPAVLTLTPLEPIGSGPRRAVEAEAARLLGWLRPDTEARQVRWA